MCGYVHVSGVVYKARGSGSPGAEVNRDHELVDMGARKQTQVL